MKVPSTPLNEDGLKSTVENLLREVEVLKNELSQIERNSEVIVKRKIYEIEEVKTLEVSWSIYKMTYIHLSIWK